MSHISIPKKTAGAAASIQFVDKSTPAFNFNGPAELYYDSDWVTATFEDKTGSKVVAIFRAEDVKSFRGPAT